MKRYTTYRVMRVDGNTEDVVADSVTINGGALGVWRDHEAVLLMAQDQWVRADAVEDVWLDDNNKIAEVRNVGFPRLRE